MRLCDGFTLADLELPDLGPGHDYSVDVGDLDGVYHAPVYQITRPTEPSSHSSSVQANPTANYHAFQYPDYSQGYRVVTARGVTNGVGYRAPASGFGPQAQLGAEAQRAVDSHQLASLRSLARSRSAAGAEARAKLLALGEPVPEPKPKAKKTKRTRAKPTEGAPLPPTARTIGPGVYGMRSETQMVLPRAPGTVIVEPRQRSRSHGTRVQTAPMGAVPVAPAPVVARDTRARSEPPSATEPAAPVRTKKKSARQVDGAAPKQHHNTLSLFQPMYAGGSMFGAKPAQDSSHRIEHGLRQLLQPETREHPVPTPLATAMHAEADKPRAHSGPYDPSSSRRAYEEEVAAYLAQEQGVRVPPPVHVSAGEVDQIEPQLSRMNLGEAPAVPRTTGAPPMPAATPAHTSSHIEPLSTPKRVLAVETGSPAYAATDAFGTPLATSVPEPWTTPRAEGLAKTLPLEAPLAHQGGAPAAPAPAVVVEEPRLPVLGPALGQAEVPYVAHVPPASPHGTRLATISELAPAEHAPHTESTEAGLRQLLEPESFHDPLPSALHESAAEHETTALHESASAREATALHTAPGPVGLVATPAIMSAASVPADVAPGAPAPPITFAPPPLPADSTHTETPLEVAQEHAKTEMGLHQLLEPESFHDPLPSALHETPHAPFDRSQSAVHVGQGPLTHVRSGMTIPHYVQVTDPAMMSAMGSTAVTQSTPVAAPALNSHETHHAAHKHAVENGLHQLLEPESRQHPLPSALEHTETRPQTAHALTPVGPYGAAEAVHAPAVAQPTPVAAPALNSHETHHAAHKHAVENGLHQLLEPESRQHPLPSALEHTETRPQTAHALTPAGPYGAAEAAHAPAHAYRPSSVPARMSYVPPPPAIPMPRAFPPLPPMPPQLPMPPALDAAPTYAEPIQPVEAAAPLPAEQLPGSAPPPAAPSVAESMPHTARLSFESLPASTRDPMRRVREAFGLSRRSSSKSTASGNRRFVPFMGESRGEQRPWRMRLGNTSESRTAHLNRSPMAAAYYDQRPVDASMMKQRGAVPMDVPAASGALEEPAPTVPTKDVHPSHAAAPPMRKFREHLDRRFSDVQRTMDAEAMHETRASNALAASDSAFAEHLGTQDAAWTAPASVSAVSSHATPAVPAAASDVRDAATERAALERQWAALEEQLRRAREAGLPPPELS